MKVSRPQHRVKSFLLPVIVVAWAVNYVDSKNMMRDHSAGMPAHQQPSAAQSSVTVDPAKQSGTSSGHHSSVFGRFLESVSSKAGSLYHSVASKSLKAAPPKPSRIIFPGQDKPIEQEAQLLKTTSDPSDDDPMLEIGQLQERLLTSTTQDPPSANPSSSGACNLAAGYVRSRSGECKLQFSTEDCDPGKWLVFDTKGVLEPGYDCVAHPCDGNFGMVPLRNGTCLEKYKLSTLLEESGYCGPNQVFVLSPSGILDCECLDGYHYWPTTDSCYQLYTTGPCKPDELLVMTTAPDGAIMSSVRPKIACKKNACHGNQLVAYSEEHGYCFKLGSQGPCRRGYHYRLHPTTFQPACLPIDEDKASSSLDRYLPSEFPLEQLSIPCRAGSVRTFKNTCPNTSSQQNSTQQKLLSSSCPSAEGNWLIQNPLTKRSECRPIPCLKNEDLLTTSGECMDSEEILQWCMQTRGTPDTRPALTAQGSVECECGKLQAFWPQDQKCYGIYTRGPCSNESQILVHSSTSRMRDASKLECVANPCKARGQVLWKMDGKCYEKGTQGPCKSNEMFKISPQTLQPVCESTQPLDERQVIPMRQSVLESEQQLLSARAGIFGMLEAYKPCRPGSKRDYKGECQLQFSFF